VYTVLQNVVNNFKYSYVFNNKTYTYALLYMIADTKVHYFINLFIEMF